MLWMLQKKYSYKPWNKQEKWLSDGFDEISPDYSPKVEMLIRTVRDKTTSKNWILSRFSCRQDLENIVGKFAFTLQLFTPENQIQFLEQYLGEVTEIYKKGYLQILAK